MQRTLPKKLTELGRIRIGDREENKSGRGTHPHKLETFRLTSSNRSLLHFAANAYGGEVCPWEGEGAPRDAYQRPTQFELYTTVNTLDVLIPTFSAVSLSFEQWSAGGCQRRCTGEFITHCPLQEMLRGTECTCPADEQVRAELAKTGKACARILRLNVLLPDLPGMGVWRLETKGYYATAELLGTLDMLQMAGQEHAIIEAALRLELRTVKRLGKGEGKGTLQFVVPVLWPKFTPRQMLSAAAQRGQLLMTPADMQQEPRLLDAPAEQAKGLNGHIADLYGGDPPAASHPLFATIEGWYADAGQPEKYAEFEVWACRRYRVNRLSDISEADKDELGRKMYATLEPLIVARQTGQNAANLPREPGKDEGKELGETTETSGDSESTGEPAGGLTNESGETTGEYGASWVSPERNLFEEDARAEREAGEEA